MSCAVTLVWEFDPWVGVLCRPLYRTLEAELEILTVTELLYEFPRGLFYRLFDRLEWAELAAPPMTERD